MSIMGTVVREGEGEGEGMMEIVKEMQMQMFIIREVQLIVTA